MKRGELAIGQQWTPPDVADGPWVEPPRPAIWRISGSLVNDEAWILPHELGIAVWWLALSDERLEQPDDAPRAHKGKREVDAKVLERLEALEAKVAALDELEARVAELEKAPGHLGPNSGPLEPNPLDWVLDHPELQQCYAGQYVAIKMGAKFEVIASNKDLGELLDSLGDNISGIYFHQFL